QARQSTSVCSSVLVSDSIPHDPRRASPVEGALLKFKTDLRTDDRRRVIDDETRDDLFDFGQETFKEMIRAAYDAHLLWILQSRHKLFDVGRRPELIQLSLNEKFWHFAVCELVKRVL